MTRAGAILLLLSLLWAGPLTVAQGAPELEVTASSPEATFEYDEETGVASDPAGIIVRYGDVQLTARTIRFNRLTSEVEAEGAVRIQQGKELWTGERVRYNFATREITANEYRAGVSPFFFAGEGLSGSLTNQVHSMTNSFVTTADRAEPGHRITARSLTFVPDKYVEIHGATFYVGKVPIMYLPSYRRHLDRHPNNFVFVPGYRSLFGPYLLTTYNWFASTNLGGAIHLDYRQKRGFAGGPDFFYDLGPAGDGELLTYYAADDEPGLDSRGEPISRDRYSVNFAHSARINSELTAKAAVRKQSDEYLRRDFFEDEYRLDVQPRTFGELSQLWPQFSLNLLAVPQVNNFFQTVERLPDARLSALPQPVGATPVYYESESSLAYLRFNYANEVQPSYEGFRADTFHQLTLPQTLFGWLNVTPRVGGRFTQYGMEKNIAPLDGSESRGVFNTGAEVSAKASRIWPRAHNRLLEVDGLRHIVEPSVNYVFVPNPSVAPDELPQFDYEMQTYRLLPITFPEYNAIDAINSQNAIRFGLRNKLQTKREEAIDNLVNWAVEFDWRLDPREDQRTYSDVYWDLDFRPRSWVTLSSELRYDINETDWRMALNTITFEPNDRWNWQFGYRYLAEWPGMGPDSGYDLLVSSLFLKLNENWAFHLGQQYSLQDHLMQEQFYSIYRDLQSWTAALTFRWRDLHEGEDDFTVAVTFSLKAFPRFKLGQDRNQRELLLGG